MTQKPATPPEPASRQPGRAQSGRQLRDRRQRRRGGLRGAFFVESASSAYSVAFTEADAERVSIEGDFLDDTITIDIDNGDDADCIGGAVAELEGP